MKVRLVLAATALGALLSVPAAHASSSLGPGVTLERSADTGRVSMIGTDPGVTIPRPAGLSASAGLRKTALAYADEFGAQLGVRGGADNLSVSSVLPSVAGGDTVRLQQSVGGLPVIGGELQVNLDRNGRLTSLSGEGEAEKPETDKAQISASDASDRAIAAVARAHGVDASTLGASTPELSILDSRILGGPGFAGPELVYKVEVGDKGAVQTIRDFVAIDAKVGFVAVQFPEIEEAKQLAVCDAGNTATRVPCNPPYARADASLGGPTGASGVTDVNKAYDYAGDTYDFYASMGRDSLDNHGLPLKSTVRYCDPSAPCPFQNAFWNGEQMVYGDGFASADDVVGHELTHGFTDFSSHLFYYYQSGAINESLSDVMGEFVDQSNGAGTDTAAVKWLLGEDVPANFNSCGANPHIVRNMKDPTDCGDPDRTGSPNYYFNPNTDFGNGDAGGVHTNSGVNNKADFLMTDGGTFNGQTVAGIGLNKVKRIYYLVDNSLLGSASDYQDLANALRQACSTLAGNGVAGITAANCAQVNKAILATQMDKPPTNAPATNPAACTSGQKLANTYNENFENASEVHSKWGVYDNSGSIAWFYPGANNPFSFDATYATSGTGNIWGYDQPTASDTAVGPVNAIKVPALGAPRLRFNQAYGFDRFNGTNYDGGTLEYSVNNGTSWNDAGSLIVANGYKGTLAGGSGNPLAGRKAFVGESGGYETTIVNLAPLKGQNVLFRFRMGTDANGFDDYGWFIDDFQVYACKNTVPPDTKITKSPKKKVKTKKKHVKVTFKFTGSDDQDPPAALKFQCDLGDGRWGTCTSPLKAKAKAGKGKGKKYTLKVRAVDSSGNVDASPAKASFRAIRKGGHKHKQNHKHKHHKHKHRRHYVLR